MKQLDPFTVAYATAALWSSTLGNGEPMDKNYDITDIAPETLDKMIADCKRFKELAFTTSGIVDFDLHIGIETLCEPEEYAGHDFWLTRNHHGCGFWDGDWQEPAAAALNVIAQSFGECDLYVGDDNLIHS